MKQKSYNEEFEEKFGSFHLDGGGTHQDITQFHQSRKEMLIKKIGEIREEKPEFGEGDIGKAHRIGTNQTTDEAIELIKEIM